MVILALLLWAGCALAAADPIVCGIELNPTKLASPGTVNVTITISNSGATDMKDPVVLYNPAAEIVSDFGANGAVVLKAGESQTWKGSYAVDQRTLDSGVVVFFVKYSIYKESGEAVAMSQSIRGKISAQTAEADIDVKRTISPSIARDGQDVLVKYDITNAGTIDLLEITIKENNQIDKNKHSIPKLTPGQTAEVKFPVKMGKKNLTSGATITYKSANNKKAQTYVVEDATIAYGESSLTAKLSASANGVAMNETVKLTLELKNGGSVDYSDIRVTDPSLGDVFTNQQLAPGKSLKLEKEITLTQTQEFQFTITAIDSTGTQTVVDSGLVKVVAVDPKDVLALTITATPDRTEVFENPGLVHFSVVIANNSAVEAKKVKVSHGGVELTTFDSIPAGASRMMTRDTALSMAGKYRFTVSAQDPLENNLTFQSNEVQIAFSVPTPAPATATPPPVPTSEPTFSPVTVPPITNLSIGTVPKLIQSVLLPILILSGLLLVTSGVLLILATKRRAQQRKESEAAVDHLERAKRRDYITPAEDETSETDRLPIDPASALGDGEEDFELPHLKYARNAADIKTPAEDDEYSTIGQGLYDEEMTSDLSAYGDQADDNVLYEQPYDDANYDQNVYASTEDEQDGYTEDLEDVVGEEPADGSGYEETAYNTGYDYDTGYEEYDDAPYDEQMIDGHIPDDREDGPDDDGGAHADDLIFRRPAQQEQPPRAAGKRSRKGASSEDVEL